MVPMGLSNYDPYPVNFHSSKHDQAGWRLGHMHGCMMGMCMGNISSLASAILSWPERTLSHYLQYTGNMIISKIGNLLMGTCHHFNHISQDIQESNISKFSSRFPALPPRICIRTFRANLAALPSMVDKR
jgi:hypothetical protein